MTRGELACFRVYPEPKTSRLFYRVRVFRTVALMHAYLRRDPIPRRPGRFCKGMCSSWKRYTSGRLHPELGEIVFAWRWLGAGLISHEATHAALAWSRRRGIDIADEGHGLNVSADEERFCYAQGEIVRQIAVQLWGRKLIS